MRQATTRSATWWNLHTPMWAWWCAPSSAAPQQQQTLVGICAYIQEKFAFFRGDFCGWKDTVRYNLSRKECFVRVPEETSSGIHRQGNSWRVDTSALSQDVFRRQHSSGLHHQGADQFHADLRMHLGVSHMVSMLETNDCEQQGTDPQADDHEKPGVPASCKVQEKKLSRLAIQLREMVARNIVRNRQFTASQASCIPPRPASVCSTATSESSGRNSPLPSTLEVESSPFEYSAFQAAVYPVQVAPSGGDPTVPPGGWAGDSFPLDLSYSASGALQHHQHLYHLQQQQQQQQHQQQQPLTNVNRYPAETHLAHHHAQSTQLLHGQHPEHAVPSSRATGAYRSTGVCRSTRVATWLRLLSLLVLAARCRFTLLINARFLRSPWLHRLVDESLRPRPGTHRRSTQTSIMLSELDLTQNDTITHWLQHWESAI